jgi:CheY-like chemotaxis protein
MVVVAPDTEVLSEIGRFIASGLPGLVTVPRVASERVGGVGSDLGLRERPSSRRRVPRRQQVRRDLGTKRFRSVLYIYGDSESRVVLARIARRWDGTRFLAAHGGREGVRLAVDLQPQLIFVDATLPDARCVDVITRLRDTRTTSPVSIAVLSGDADPGERALLVMAGANAHLSKPLNVSSVDHVAADLMKVTSVP